MSVVRSLVSQVDCETDSRLRQSTANEFHLIHPRIVLSKAVSNLGALAGAVSILRGGIETQGWLSLKVSWMDDRLNRRPVS